MKKHSNLSIFISHQGCTYKCSFCNQIKINKHDKPPTKQEVYDICNQYLPTDNRAKNTEIAFFGGSFTAINRKYMLDLLEVANSFILNKRAMGIRISTRPDAIDDEILLILKKYGVTAIELGAQSMQDDILLKNYRGHTAKQVVEASKLIQQYGFSLGLQMMTGLYGEEDTMSSAIYTANQFIKIKPDTVRIYPTLIFKNTMLENLYIKGIYNAQSLQNAIDVCAVLLELFNDNNINVIRVGLHSDIDMDSFVSGPFHPAFKQFCESKIYFNKLTNLLKGKNKGEYTFSIPKGELSTVVGQKKCNTNAFKNLGYSLSFIENKNIEHLNITSNQ